MKLSQAFTNKVASAAWASDPSQSKQELTVEAMRHFAV